MFRILQTCSLLLSILTQYSTATPKWFVFRSIWVKIFQYVLSFRISYNAAFRWLPSGRRIAALIVIFVQLRKRYLSQKEDQTVSSVLPTSIPPPSPLCPSRGQLTVHHRAQTVDSGAMPLKRQAVITRRSGKAVSGKLVWNNFWKL